MRLLVVNPNTSPTHTRIIEKAAHAAAGPDTTLRVLNAPFGGNYIGTRGEAAIASYATLLVLGEHASGYDAVVIAAFVDPGLLPARELLPIPVVGIVEAACLTACMLGGRFAVVTTGSRLVPVFHEVIRSYGLAERLAAIEAVKDPNERLITEPSRLADALVAAARRAVHRSGAEVVLLGGAPLSEVTDEIASRLEVPVLDGVACAVRQAELLVRLGARRPAAGSFSAPGRRALVGVPEPLVRLFRPDGK